MLSFDVNLNQLRVQDLMTSSPHVVTVDANDNLGTVAKLLWDNRIHSVIVLKNRKIHRIITSLDVVNIIIESFNHGLNLSDIPLDRFMQNQELITVAPDTPIKEAVEKMGRGKFSHLPVTNNGEVMGILSSNDIIRYTESQISSLPSTRYL